MQDGNGMYLSFGTALVNEEALALGEEKDHDD
jgi:hypothetical protein